MACDICKILENKEAFKFIYEDDKCFAILHESPATKGHILLIPKKHFPILEEVDEEIIKHLSIVANKISNALFIALEAQGTNIIINNGLSAGQELPHVIINIIPRYNKDNLNFDWQAKRANEQELKTIQSLIKNLSFNIFEGKEITPKTNIKEIEHTNNKNEEDYLVKRLKRIP